MVHRRYAGIVPALLLIHPGRIAMAVLGLISLLVLVFSAAIHRRARHVREIYRRHFAQPHRERQLIAAVAFYITFACVRILTHTIRAGRGPFHNIQAGGLHIHHLVFGIILLLIVGYGWLTMGSRTRSRWPGRWMALLYGVGTALTLDEFALWLNLQDVYWERQGRESVDAVVLFGALLAMSAAGGRFLHALAREAFGKRDHVEGGEPTIS